MRICVYGASSNAIDKDFITSVEVFGRKLADRGHSLVFGGGAQGLMGAAARGVYEKGGKIMGVSPKFFDVDGILFENCTELVFTDTMRERKQTMEDNADAFVITPGGIGTYEEFFEILTLKQLGRHAKAIVIYNISGYYDTMLKMMDETVEKKFMKETAYELYKVFDDADKMLDYIEQYKGKSSGAKYFKNI